MKYVGNDKEIVFLNSGNIISDLNGLVEYNGIPSHTLFKASYDVLSGNDEYLSAHLSCVELSIHTLSNTIDVKMAEEHRALSNYINQRVSTAYKPQGSVKEYSDLDKISASWIAGITEEDEKISVLSSHIGDVWNVIGKGKDTELSGQNYVWVYQGLVGHPETKVWGWDEIGGFVNFYNFYTKDQVNGISASLSAQLTSFEKTQIDASYEKLTAIVNGVSTEITCAVDGIDSRLTSVQDQADILSAHVGDIQGYVDYLSCKDYDNPGAIPKMSADISACGVAAINMLKFIGHIRDAEKLSASTLTGYFYSSFERGKVKNGSFFDVDFTTRGVEKIQTIDLSSPLAVGNGDVVIIHDHSNNEFVQAADLRLHTSDDKGAGNVYVFKAGVSKYEFIALTESVDRIKADARDNIKNCYAKISSIGYDITEEACVSCVVEIKNMLSDLIGTLII